MFFACLAKLQVMGYLQKTYSHTFLKQLTLCIITLGLTSCLSWVSEVHFVSGQLLSMCWFTDVRSSMKWLTNRCASGVSIETIDVCATKKWSGKCVSTKFLDIHSDEKFDYVLLLSQSCILACWKLLYNVRRVKVLRKVFML